ncbi:NAD-dependent epimerase/dehydratase family protein [Glacieibacterium megasporae]|uniref:NAD-dependent epimerase/dehydratase family protein n=1 Tax=Glacieibacterium megasporae TaxID=2835787 RepID=UPI001C1DD0D7|nr:NAD-dependent epimerase/dehydratase family protein [Polymorphobacter megasporae]UAJ11768.1 NAD-dependent epimerase/dehydratase family protein [Polymorphobacter megasporae]
MTQQITIFGYGATGRPIAELLAARGDAVRVATRNRPANLPAGVEHMVCDVLDRADVLRALAGSAQAVLAVGFAYDSRLWRTVWPTTMTNMIEGCAETGARLVLIDNLYQLGPQTAPRTEDMPLGTTGEKPVILAEVTRIWQAARGRVKVAALRCSDFYGPGVAVSHLGVSAFGELANGRPAQLLVPADTPHDFAYVPDIARAMVMLLDADDADFGQAWNMPCAPTRSPRALLAMGAVALGKPLKLWAIPFALLRPIGLFYRFAREVVDVGFTWDRPYVVDGGKFARRFGFVPTPFETGVPATVRAFAEGR